MPELNNSQQGKLCSCRKKPTQLMRQIYQPGTELDIQCLLGNNSLEGKHLVKGLVVEPFLNHSMFQGNKGPQDR
jgi:hypothetical protein